jgi:hypothetical protein
VEDLRRPEVVTRWSGASPTTTTSHRGAQRVGHRRPRHQARHPRLHRPHRDARDRAAGLAGPRVRAISPARTSRSSRSR